MTVPFIALKASVSKQKKTHIKQLNGSWKMHKIEQLTVSSVVPRTIGRARNSYTSACLDFS